MGASYDDESNEIDEVFDEEIRIEHWMNDDVPGLDGMNANEESLITDFDINEGDPDEIESEGYMGNYGPEVSYWYHYGAIFLWPKEKQADVLKPLPLQTKLNWLRYYFNHWKELDNSEKEITEQIFEILPVSPPCRMEKKRKLILVY